MTERVLPVDHPILDLLTKPLETRDQLAGDWGEQSKLAVPRPRAGLEDRRT